MVAPSISNLAGKIQILAGKVCLHLLADDTSGGIVY